MALRLNFGVDPPQGTAFLDPWAPGLGDAPPGQAMAPGISLPGGGDEYLALAKRMLLQQLQQEQAPSTPEKKKGFDFMYLIPGYAEGKAEKEQRDQQKHLLKLQQRQMAGADAAHQLQRLQMLGKLEQQEQQRQVGQQISALFGQGQALTNPAMQQQVLAAVARTGNLDLLTKMQAYFQGQQDLDVLNAPPGAVGPLGQPETPLPTAPTAPAGGATTGRGTYPPLADRLNNPLNMKLGPATQYLVEQGVATPGQAATDGGRFLQFQTPEAGMQAADRLFRGPVYAGLSVDAALKKWSNKGYDGTLALKAGVNPSITVGSLTAAQRGKILQAMAAVERGGSPAPGTATGSTAAPAPPAAPATDGDRLRLRGLEAQRDQMTTTLQELQQIQRRIRTKELRQEVEGRLRETRQQLQLVETQIQHLDTRLYERGPEKLARQESVARAGIEASLDKPISSEDASLYGVPAGTTARELRERVGTAPAPLKGEAAKAFHLGNRMMLGHGTVSQLEAQGVTGTPFLNAVEQAADKLTGAVGTVLGLAVGGGVPGAAAGAAGGYGIGGLAGVLVNLARSPAERLYLTAQLSFIAGILRKESGAAITAEEYKQYSRIYFPQPNDDAQTVAYKRELRQSELNSLQEQFPNRPFRSAPVLPAPRPRPEEHPPTRPGSPPEGLTGVRDTPPAAHAVDILRGMTPQQLLSVSSALLAGLTSPEQVQGLSMAQRRALQIRLARKQREESPDAPR